MLAVTYIKGFFEGGTVNENYEPAASALPNPSKRRGISITTLEVKTDNSLRPS